MLENQEIIDIIKKTYGFYHQRYVVMTKKYTKTVSHYFRDKVIDSHLNGYYALGTFAGDKVTRFISVDIDEGGKKAVKLVMGAFEKLGIPHDKIFVSTSGKKGYHVDIFFSPWLYNEKAKNLYDLMIWQTGLNPKKVEFLPTPGHAVKIPLGLHAVTRNRCWYLDRDTLQPIERMDYIKEITPVDNAVVLDILREWNKKRWNELYAEMICNDTGHDISIEKDIEFNEEYYEARQITERGTRHDTMVKIACDLRHYGANRFQIRKALKGFLYKQDFAYIETSEDDCLDDIDAISDWAEKSVPIYKQRQAPTGEPKTVRFEKRDINIMLMSATSPITRKVAFLLYSYCKLFGAAHVSYESIANTIGCSVSTAKVAVKNLLKSKVLLHKPGGCHQRNGKMIRESNTYFIPKYMPFWDPPDDYLLNDSFEFQEKVNKETISSLYYRMLAKMCRPEYLARYLKKPELEECKAVCAE